MQRFDVAKPDTDVRRACQKREYRYYVPYRALLTAEEQAQAAAAAAQAAANGGGGCCTVWLCGLPDVCSAETIQVRTKKSRLLFFSVSSVFFLSRSVDLARRQSSNHLSEKTSKSQKRNKEAAVSGR